MCTCKEPQTARHHVSLFSRRIIAVIIISKDVKVVGMISKSCYLGGLKMSFAKIVSANSGYWKTEWRCQRLDRLAQPNDDFFPILFSLQLQTFHVNLSQTCECSDSGSQTPPCGFLEERLSSLGVIILKEDLLSRSHNAGQPSTS